jgi:hypothetical protein
MGHAAEVDPIFVSVKQAAQMLGLSTWSVYKMLDDPTCELTSQYQGRRRLVRYASVVAYANNLPTTAPESA